MEPVLDIAERAQGVGGDLRALRKARGLTLTELALKVGRSVGWLSQIERDLAVFQLVGAFGRGGEVRQKLGHRHFPLSQILRQLS